MEALGLHRTVPEVSSGSFARDTNATLTGHADEGAAAWVFARAPAAPPEDMILSEIRAVLDDCLPLGLTSLVAAAVGFILGYDKEAAIWWAQLRAQGNVPVR